MDYETFKAEMKLIKPYYLSAKKIKEEIEKLNYDLANVKGVRFDRQPSSYNQSLSEQRRLELIEEIEKKEKELDHTIMSVKRYESNLNRLPKSIRFAVKQIFIYGKSFAEVGKTMGYSDHGLHRRVKKEVEKL